MKRNPPELVRQRALSRQWRAIYILHVHKIVRASMASQQFGSLVKQGHASRRFTGPRMRPDQCDYILTWQGQCLAQDLF